MTRPTARTRVQKTLIDLAKAGKFYKVEYDTNDEPKEVDDAAVVPPASVKANEIGSKFASDKKYGRSRKLARSVWQFALMLEWNNQEVSLSDFEQALMDDPPFIAKDDTHGLPAVTLILLSAAYVHPVTQQPDTGTQVTYTFQAELGRN